MKSRPHQAADPATPPAEGRTEEMPYPVTLVHEQGEWLATIDALPGCTARGATPDDAMERASEAMAAWLLAARREGKDVPEPKTAGSHSGRLLLRMPQTLHAELARTAEREKVSLNQFITDTLAGALGWRTTGRKAKVARAVPGLDDEGDVEPRSASSGEPAASTEERSRISSTVFVLNGIIVALAAVVAIVVLVVVLWR